MKTIFKVETTDNSSFDIDNWWNDILPKYQDLELQNKIDSLNIEIDFMQDDYGLQLSNNKDFEVSYEYNSKDPMQDYGHTKELNYLFVHGFKYILVDYKSKLYYKLSNTCGEFKQHRCVRSPEPNIVSECNIRNKLALFIKDNKFLYAYSGSCYASNILTYYFDYVGLINQQLSLF